jgi:hypothetical protein
VERSFSHADLDGSDSPAIDAGTNVALADVFFGRASGYTTRRDGLPEVNGSNVDIGYHYASDWEPPAGTMFTIR